MDIHRQANPYPHFGVNGGHDDARRNSQSRTRSNMSEDEALQFLSQEEQECILFFEETIDSLEEELEIREVPPSGGDTSVDGRDGPPALTSTPNSSAPPHRADRPANPKDQDIIDLVRPEPGPAQVKEVPINPAVPDFQSMAVNPASHIEIRPKREPVDYLPAEYNPPLPSGSQSDSADDGVSYHPVGSVPTPVLIAQKIAENQGGEAANIISASRLRRRSLDSDQPAKQGPPTSTKPTRFPGNINLMLGGNKEQHGQSLTSVNIQERQAQMLANLSGTSHPPETAEPQSTALQKARNLPTRSVSFRDPTPDKSRMEALSMLGLTRNRAKSGGMSITFTPNPNPTSAPPPASTPAPVDPPSSAGGRTIQVYPPPPETSGSSAASPPPEVASLDFNSYGGKSIVVHPSATSRSAVAVSAGGHDGKVQPAGLATPSDFNSYGGKSKVMTSGPVVTSDLPDILASHRAVPPPASPPASAPAPSKPDALPCELNPYGGKTRTVTPSSAAHCTPDVTTHSPAWTSRSPAPNLAPRPPRPQAPSPHRKMSLGSSPEARRKSITKSAPSFRSQGITVQFSGRGATDESRREALRKLGLLKETS